MGFVNSVTYQRPSRFVRGFGAIDDTVESDLVTPEEQVARKPTNVVTKVFDFLQRGQYASLAAVDQLTSPGRTLVDAYEAAQAELVDPHLRLSASDLIRKGAPEFAEDHPIMTAVAGLAVDVLNPLDPVNWVGADELVHLYSTTKGVLRASERAVGAWRRANEVAVKGIDAGLPEFFSGMGKVLDVARSRVEKGADVGLIANQLTVHGKAAARKAEDRLFGAYRTYLDNLAQDTGLRGVDETTKLAFETLSAQHAARLVEDMRGSTQQGAAAVADTFRARIAKENKEFFSSFSPMPDADGRTVDFLAGVHSGMGDVGLQLRTVLESEAQALARSPKIAEELAHRMPLMELEDINPLFSARDLPAGRLTPEGRIRTMMEDPDFAKQFETAGGLGFKIPYTGKFVSLIPGKVFDKVADLMGITRYMKEVKEGTRTSALTSINRRLMPQEVLEARDEFYGAMEAARRETVSSVVKVFGGLQQESRAKLGRLGWQMDELQATFYKSAEGGRFNQTKLGEGMRTLLEGAELTPEEHKAWNKLQSAYRRQFDYEMEAGLLKETWRRAAYSPHYYTTITGKRFGASLAAAKPNSREAGAILEAFGPAKEQVFDTVEEARKHGFEPIYDAAVVYQQRLATHRRRLAQEIYRDRVKAAYGSLENVPDHVRTDLEFTLDGVYGRNSSVSSTRFWHAFDKVQGVFKRGATVARTGFGSRQVPSNAIQAYLESGGKVMPGLMNPVILMDAVRLTLGGATDGLHAVKTPFGVISGEQLVDELSRLAVAQVTDVSGHFETLARTSTAKQVKNLSAELDRKLSLATKPAGVEKGLRVLAAGAGNYMRFPGVVEGVMRTAMYIQGRKLGLSEGEALEKVNKALFDYANGTTAFEARVAKRLIPFYSYNRYAVPLVTRVLATHPGRVANVGRVTDKFLDAWGRLWGGEDLSPAERSVLPGYILDQPSRFSHIQQNMQAVFNTFNNMTPIDVLSGVQYNVDGSINWQHTLEQQALAQLTPFLKVPGELILNRDFFTQSTFRDTKDLKDVDPEKLVANLAAVATSGAMGIVGSRFTTAGRALISPLAEGVVGELGGASTILHGLLGAEPGINPRTGEPTVYVNPFLAHVAVSLFPALQDAFKLSRNDRTPTENTMHLLFGIGTHKVNLNEEARRRSREMKAEAGRKKSAYVEAQAEHAERRMHDTYEDYKKFMEQMATAYGRMGQGRIRG